MSEFKSAPFICSACGEFNGPTANNAARDHCRVCAASLHVQFGDSKHQPCGGTMRANDLGERSYSGAISGTFMLTEWHCKCGFTVTGPRNEDHEHYGPLVRMMTSKGLTGITTSK